MADQIEGAVDEIQGAPDTFSSWDKCMEKDYCKYPAIIGIVIGALIAISLIWCCVRCCCCGLNCCCGCLSCFNRCCPSGRSRKKSKFRDPEPGPSTPNPYGGYIPPSNPPTYNTASTATFDVPGRPVNGDALPSMPTWKDGKLQEGSPRGMGPNENSQMNGAVPLGGVGRMNSRGYSELSGQDRLVDQPGQYRGANTTHPYNSDLGAQSFVSQQNSVYQTPPTQSPVGGFPAPGAGPGGLNPHSPRAQPTLPSLPSPQMSQHGQPPRFLQVGRR